MAKKMKKKGLAINNITFQDFPCPINSAGIAHIDYRDVEFLKLFLTEKGKIMPRRITGVSSTNQKKLTRAIKRARDLALLSFSEGYISLENEEGSSLESIETTENETVVSAEEEVSSESNS